MLSKTTKDRLRRRRSEVCSSALLMKRVRRNAVPCALTATRTMAENRIPEMCLEREMNFLRTECRTLRTYYSVLLHGKRKEKSTTHGHRHARGRNGRPDSERN